MNPVDVGDMDGLDWDGDWDGEMSTGGLESLNLNRINEFFVVISC